MSTVKAYLLTIARNLFLQQLRRSRRQDELDHDVADPAPGPADAAEQRDELRAVMREVQKLPEVDRAALIMRVEQGLAYEEIARALGVSPAAAKVKVHRARLKRRSTLMACGIFFSLLPFSFYAGPGGVHWLWAYAPGAAGLAALVGLACWVGYYATKHSLRATGL